MLVKQLSNLLNANYFSSSAIPILCAFNLNGSLISCSLLNISLFLLSTFLSAASFTCSAFFDCVVWMRLCAFVFVGHRIVEKLSPAELIYTQAALCCNDKHTFDNSYRTVDVIADSSQPYFSSPLSSFTCNQRSSFSNGSKSSSGDAQNSLRRKLCGMFVQI